MQARLVLRVCLSTGEICCNAGRRWLEKEAVVRGARMFHDVQHPRMRSKLFRAAHAR